MRSVSDTVAILGSSSTERHTGTGLLKKRGKSAKRGQTGDIKQDEQPIGELKRQKIGCSESDGLSECV